jgi:hypothetical protein
MGMAGMGVPRVKVSFCARRGIPVYPCSSVVQMRFFESVPARDCRGLFWVIFFLHQKFASYFWGDSFFRGARNANLTGGAIAKGDGGELLPLGDEELRRGERDGPEEFKSRAHFLGMAAEAMRRILIDRARTQYARQDLAKEHMKLRYFSGRAIAHARRKFWTFPNRSPNGLGRSPGPGRSQKSQRHKRPGEKLFPGGCPAPRLLPFGHWCGPRFNAASGILLEGGTKFTATKKKLNTRWCAREDLNLQNKESRLISYCR